MAKNKIFGDMTFDEIEKFEKDTEGIVLLNETGENALAIQKSENFLIIYADDVQEGSDTFPNLFMFSTQNIVKLYNFLSNIINSSPDKYKIINGNES